MKPENSIKRKKALLRFGALYAGSVALLLMIGIFFNGQETSGAVGGELHNTPSPSNTGFLIDKVNILLGRRLQQLRALDEKYAALLADSASLSDLKDADKMITAAEGALKNSIDSLDREGPLYEAGTASYRMILEDRRAIASIRIAIAAGHNAGMTVDQLELFRLKMELSGKDKDLADLEYQLKASQDSKDLSGTAGKDLPEASPEMIQALQNENKALKESAATLRYTNEQLAAQVQETRKLAPAPEASAVPSKDREGGSEAKLTELSSELRFAQVDCNLSRADGRQTVYNSKQRKDLLEDALTTLKELAASDNIAVQKKAKEKLTLLRSIASTIHD